jgi:hypothetical protein
MIALNQAIEFLQQIKPVFVKLELSQNFARLNSSVLRPQLKSLALKQIPSNSFSAHQGFVRCPLVFMQAERL